MASIGAVGSGAGLWRGLCLLCLWERRDWERAPATRRWCVGNGVFEDMCLCPPVSARSADA